MIDTREKARQLSIDIGKKIRAAREESTLSQADVGKNIGVSDKTVSGYESGRISPPIDKLVALAELFKKPIAYFLGADPKDYRVASRLRAVEVALMDVREQLKQVKLVAQTLDLDS